MRKGPVFIRCAARLAVPDIAQNKNVVLLLFVVNARTGADVVSGYVAAAKGEGRCKGKGKTFRIFNACFLNVDLGEDRAGKGEEQDAGEYTRNCIAAAVKYYAHESSGSG